MTTPTPIPAEGTIPDASELVKDGLAEWEDPQTQFVYEVLCSDKLEPPEGEHWEGYLARIIAAHFASRPSASSTVAEGQVGVKALAWREEARDIAPGDMIADTPFGPYRVGRYGRFWTVYLNDDLVTEQPSDADAAKRAAQADYTARILSALATDPQPQPTHWHNGAGQLLTAQAKKIAALNDEVYASRFSEPLYAHPEPVAPQGTREPIGYVTKEDAALAAAQPNPDAPEGGKL